MTAGACPRCGGSERRLLAPGFYECVSLVLSGVVPRGAQGNRTDLPMSGVCGHRYQEGAGAVTTLKCSCGMFAVGECAVCGQPRCGEHGDHDHGRFVCVAHIIEAVGQAEEQARRRRRHELEEAQAAIRQEAQALLKAAPGFPASPTSGPQLAAALERLVPFRKERFQAGPQRRFHRTPDVGGWAFLLAREGPDGNGSFGFYYLVVTDDGMLFPIWEMARIPDWRPYQVYRIERKEPADWFYTAGDLSAPWGGGEGHIAGEYWRRVLVHMLNWIDRRPSFAPSFEQRKLVARELAFARNGRGLSEGLWTNEQLAAEKFLANSPAT